MFKRNTAFNPKRKFKYFLQLFVLLFCIQESITPTFSMIRRTNPKPEKIKKQSLKPKTKGKKVTRKGKKSAKNGKTTSKKEEKTVSKDINKDIPICCVLDETFASDVTIDRICLRKGQTHIEISFENPLEGCSVLEDTVLTDNTGKRYRAIAMQGITRCPGFTGFRKTDSFEWHFEKLDPNIQRISLYEKPNIGYTRPWKWYDVDVSYCNFSFGKKSP